MNDQHLSILRLHCTLSVISTTSEKKHDVESSWQMENNTHTNTFACPVMWSENLYYEVSWGYPLYSFTKSSLSWSKMKNEEGRENRSKKKIGSNNNKAIESARRQQQQQQRKKWQSIAASEQQQKENVFFSLFCWTMNGSRGSETWHDILSLYIWVCAYVRVYGCVCLSVCSASIYIRSKNEQYIFKYVHYKNIIPTGGERERERCFKHKRKKRRDEKKRKFEHAWWNGKALIFWSMSEKNIAKSKRW